MASVVELADRVNRGEPVAPVQLEVYEKSANGVETFLSNRAAATLAMRKANGHLRKCLDAIEYSDRKVLEEYLSTCEFLSLTEDRIEPTAQFGAAAIERGDCSLGIEAIQSAVAQGSNGSDFLSDPDHCLWIASQYDHAARRIGWGTPQGYDWRNGVIRLGFVVPGISDDGTTTRILAGLAENLHPTRCEFYIYSTESAVRRAGERFPQPSYVASSLERGAVSIRKLQESGAGVWVAPCDGDALSAAGALAEKMVLDRIDAVIFDTTQADAIAAVVASWPVARAKINWCRTTPLYAPEISTVVYRDADRHESTKDDWAALGVESCCIVEGIAMPPAGQATPARAALGIPDSAIVLATAGENLDQTLGEEFVDGVIETLRTHRQAIYLIIGPGDFSRQKRQFERGGVSGRVGYVANNANVLGICDIYIADISHAETDGTLTAMGMAKPILIGEPGEQFSARLSKLIRHPHQRMILGQTMRRQAQEHFSARRMAQQIEKLCWNLLRSRPTIAPEQVPEEDIPQAKVA